MRLFILVATLLALSEQHELVKRASGSGGGRKRVVCYYTNWSVYRPGTAKFNPQNINPYLCTHLIYAFGGLDRENGLRPYDKYQDIEQGGYAKFTGLKTYNKELKTMLAIGGWNEGSARFSPLVADEERRREFVRNVIKFLRQNHFDGLDLDWEYPAYRDGGKPRDRDNYAQLVQELREEFERESSKTGRPRLLLTMAVPAGLEYIDKGYDIPKLNRYLDFMNILSYDYHSAFEPSVNHHSPLYSIEEESEYNFDSKLTIDATIKHYLMKGADADKLVLGIPTYGRSYTLFNPDSTDLGSPADGPGEQGEATREKGYLAYYEICSNINDGWTVIQPKEKAMGPYAYKENQWVGYDDEAIVRKKSQYVNERNLGGIMFWSIDNDDFRGKCHSRPYPLIEAAKEALLGKGVSNKLPSSTRGGKISKQGRPKTTQRSTTTPALPAATVTTPEPPTTPDPGSDFVCKDEGFFPHPRDCKKYFWCLDSGPSDLGIVAHQFTCPSGLYFNKAADSCDFSRNVICKKKSTSSATTTTTTTAAPKTSKSSYGKITLPPKTTTYTTTTTTTTSTTPEPPVFEEEEDEIDEDYKEEDPQTIKQLIHLIKKLGGVAELEKQLEGNSGVEITTPAISKSLYQRVINSGSPKYQTIQRNGPSGPQNEGLPRERSSSSFRRDNKPQYVTIKRDRPSTTTENTEIVYAVVEDEEDRGEEEIVTKGTPKYQSILRNRGSQTPQSGDQPSEDNEKPVRPKYQPSERFRPKVRTEERAEERDISPERPTTLKYTSILRSRAPTSSDSIATTSKYVVLQRQRTTTNQLPDDIGTTENELNDEEEVTEHVIDTTTPRPRVKVSEIVPTTVSVPTSTRVVTEIVEGATQRQRVPLSKLRQFFKLKELDNSVIETVTVDSKSTTTEEIKSERPLLHGFNRRRPEIVITTTARTTPAFLSQRRNRIRSTTEPIDISTKGRFVPSRTRSKTNEISKDEIIPRFAQRTQTPSENAEEDSHSSTTGLPRERSTYKNRFSFRRRTTEKPVDNQDDSKDELFIEGNSRDSNVIRKPIYKPRFPSRRRSTTPETVTLTPSSLPTENISPSSEKVSSTTETILDGEVLKPVENIHTTPINSDFLGTTDSPITTVIIPSMPENNSINISTTSRDLFLEEINKLNVEEINKLSNDTATNSDHSSSTTERISQEWEQTTTDVTTTLEEKLKFASLPLVSPTEINGMTSENERKTTVSSTESDPIVKFTSRFHRLPSFEVESNTKLPARERLNYGRKFINAQNNSDNIVREIIEAERDGRKKIILRRRKPTTESNYVSEVKENNYKINRTTVARRKRPEIEENDLTPKENNPKTEPPKKTQRGKVKFNAQVDKIDANHAEDSLASPTKDTTRTRFRGSSRTARPEVTSQSTPAELKHKRVIMRVRKKYAENEDTGNPDNSADTKYKRRNEVNGVSLERGNHNATNKVNTTADVPLQRQKIRKVLLRKTVKDLAVGESMSPGKGESFEKSNLKDFDKDEDLDIDFTEDIIHTSNGEQEIQTRSRRPFRKTVVRSTTTSTTEAPTTSRQRTTAQSLRQRLNRFRSERNFAKATTTAAPLNEEPQDYSTAVDENPTTQRATRKEFRRLIKPLHVDDSQLDASHFEAKNTPQNEIRVSQKPQSQLSITEKYQNEVRITQKPQRQYLEQVTEGSVLSEEYTEEEPLVLPDLANVAVAAIQSLATSAPPKTTSEKYREPVTQRVTRPPVVRRRPQTPRPTHAPPTRSSPRPFSKINYEDYEDYYAEPVDVPLSGKVRIHNDGYIECLDIGNFPHPFSCRKFISCAKMENSHLLGWEYTCPKGLSFDPIGGICNWNAGLGCKE